MGYTWDWFHHFTTNKTVDRMFRGAQEPYFNGTRDWLKCAFSFGCIKHSDDAVYNATVKAIKEMQPNLIFLHFCKQCILPYVQYTCLAASLAASKFA